jgi:hypothetical protein
MKKQIKEKEYYQRIKDLILRVFGPKFDEISLEITATKVFSNNLKSKIPENRNIIFNFLKEAPPDITGIIKDQDAYQYFVAEIKNERLKLDDIYQTRKYGELFEAKYVLLISTEEIPEELKRLSKVMYNLLSLPSYRRIILVRYDEKQDRFVDWFENNPLLI